MSLSMQYGLIQTVEAGSLLYADFVTLMSSTFLLLWDIFPGVLDILKSRMNDCYRYSESMLQYVYSSSIARKMNWSYFV